LFIGEYPDSIGFVIFGMGGGGIVKRLFVVNEILLLEHGSKKIFGGKK
jgi:hypothetical protein